MVVHAYQLEKVGQTEILLHFVWPKANEKGIEILFSGIEIREKRLLGD